jgi:prepilin-type N-terminal cleavage/methylation domain-containing protein/prepilin-type processing-associated H-X9-DG protein
MNLPRIKKHAAGFTLVELLVVISIIALLLAILMPSLQNARQQAKNVVCTSNMRQAQLGLILYLQDNKDRFFQSSTVYDKIWSALYKEARYPFAGDLCPNSRQRGSYIPDVYTRITYAYNAGLGHGEWGSRYGRNLSSEIKSPRRTISFCESLGYYYWNSLYGQGVYCGMPGRWEKNVFTSGRLAVSHKEAQNLSFLDGHVEHRKITSLSYKDWDFELPR